MKKLAFAAVCCCLGVAALAQTEKKLVIDTVKDTKLIICPKTVTIDILALSAGVYIRIGSAREVKCYPYNNTNDIVTAMTGAYQRRRGDDVSFFGGR